MDINRRFTMKKSVATILAVLMAATPVFANDTVRVFSNGNEVADKGIIVDGRTLVPVRGVFEYMGYDVEWDNSTKTATLTNEKKNSVITLTNGESTFNVNDKTITPDVPQQIVDGRFMLPLRAVGEAVDAKVGWNQDTKTATINENNNFFKMDNVDKDDPIIDEMPVNEVTANDSKEEVNIDAIHEELKKQIEELQKAEKPKDSPRNNINNKQN